LYSKGQSCERAEILAKIGLFALEQVPAQQEEKLTLKQRKFLRFYLETGNISQSARKAGYAHHVRGFELVRKSTFRAAFQELLDKNGITDQYLSDVLKGGLAAKKIQNVNIVLRENDDGKLEVQDTNDFIEVDDWPTRHKYLETALNLKDKILSAQDKTGNGSPSGSGATFETYFVELIKKCNQDLNNKAADGIKITRTEFRNLDRFV
jgi:phage terminase small subunit